MNGRPVLFGLILVLATLSFGCAHIPERNDECVSGPLEPRRSYCAERWDRFDRGRWDRR